MKKRIISLMVIFLFATSLMYAQNKSKDIVDVAKEAGSFNTLLTAATKAGLVETLKSEGPFTIFAPTDEAFAKLPTHVVENLLKPENKDQLAAILKYHVLSGKVLASKAIKLNGAETVNGQRLSLNLKKDNLFINKSKVVKADINASNGVIHVIDAVLLPSDKNIVEIAAEAGTFNTLIAAVKAAGLAETLMGDGPFTVLAPTDEAFAKLPEGTVENLLKKENLAQLQDILKYHVISGRVYSETVVKLNSAKAISSEKLNIKISDGIVMINNARVLKTDIDATNGVIHVIDNVLIPGVTEETTMLPTDIIELAIERGVPLFNHGNSQACVYVYEVAAQALLSNSKMLNQTAKQALSRSLQNIDNMHSYNDKAWELRRGLDKAYTAMSKQMMSAKI